MLKSSVRNAWAVWILFKTCQESIPLFSRCYSSVAYNFQAPTIQSTCIRNATQSSGITQRKAGPPGVENGHPWAPKMAVVDWFYCRKHGIFDDLRSKPLTFESKPKNLCPPVAGTEMPSRRKKLPQTVRKWVWRAGIFPPAHKLDTFLAFKQCAKHSATVSIRQDIVLPCASVRVETALTFESAVQTALTYESTPWANRCRLSETTAKPSPDSRSACWPAVAERT